MKIYVEQVQKARIRCPVVVYDDINAVIFEGKRPEKLTKENDIFVIFSIDFVD